MFLVAAPQEAVFDSSRLCNLFAICEACSVRNLHTEMSVVVTTVGALFSWVGALASTSGGGDILALTVVVVALTALA